MKKDYIRDKWAALELVDTIRGYWHDRGFTSVKVWVREETPISPLGTPLPTNYYVDSNIKFDCSDLE
jgi:hypothetical protein